MIFFIYRALFKILIKSTTSELNRIVIKVKKQFKEISGSADQIFWSRSFQSHGALTANVPFSFIWVSGTQSRPLSEDVEVRAGEKGTNRSDR